MSRNYQRRCGLLLATLLSLASAHAQVTSSLLPMWSFATDEPYWRVEVVPTSAEDMDNLRSVALKHLDVGCFAFETIDMTFVGDPDEFGPPIADIDFLAILEEHYSGSVIVDANLTSTYGHSADGTLVFSWESPWGLWPFEGIYLLFKVCSTVPR